MTQTYKIAIPMAGFGTRMRPHTWSKAKPLIHLAGKTVLDYVLAQFNSLPDVDNAEFILIVSPHQEEQIRAHMQKYYPERAIHYVVQKEMRGQSDALYQARQYLNGPLLMSFSDTLVEVDLSSLKSETSDGIAWVKPVPDPRRFGVALINADGQVTRLIEKPQDTANNLAVVGFYYFRSGEALIAAIEEQFKHNMSLKNEFFLVDAINVLLKTGSRFYTREVEEWLDAGVPEATLETNRYFLAHGHDNSVKASERDGVAIIPPVYIAEDAQIESSVIGPNVSIASGCFLQGVVVRNTLIDSDTRLENIVLEKSLIGRNVQVKGRLQQFNLGDDSQMVK